MAIGEVDRQILAAAPLPGGVPNKTAYELVAGRDVGDDIGRGPSFAQSAVGPTASRKRIDRLQVPVARLGEPAWLSFHRDYLTAAEGFRRAQAARRFAWSSTRPPTDGVALSLFLASTLCATLGVTSSALCWGQGGMGWSVRDSRWSSRPPWSWRPPHPQRACRRRPRQVSPSRYRLWSIRSIPTASPTSGSIHRAESSSAGRPAPERSAAPGSARLIRARRFG